MNSPAFFEIQADDPERAVAFYKTVLGWSFTKVTGLPIDYWLIQTEGIRGGLLKRPATAPPPRSGTNAYVCSMQVEDFDPTAKVILKSGGQVALEKFAVPGTCWQGYFLVSRAIRLEYFRSTKTRNSRYRAGIQAISCVLRVHGGPLVRLGLHPGSQTRITGHELLYRGPHLGCPDRKVLHGHCIYSRIPQGVLHKAMPFFRRQQMHVGHCGRLA